MNIIMDYPKPEPDSNPKDKYLAFVFKNAYEYFTYSEKQLLRNMIGNKFYPFTQLSSNMHEFEHRNKKFYASFLFIILALLWVALIYGIRSVQTESSSPTTTTSTSVPVGTSVDHFEAGTILGLIVLCAMSVYFLMYWPKRHYVLARDRRAFQYYIGGNLVMQSHLHNICILLKQSYAADGRRWAHLEISGYKLEATRISGQSSHLQLMRFLGRRMAKRNDLNFFDTELASANHSIQHRCPLRQKTNQSDVKAENSALSQCKTGQPAACGDTNM